MTTRGTTIKTDTPELLTLLRPMITRRYELFVDHEACCGCQICELVCPREAISLSEATLEDGRVVVETRVDIDETKCSFCGECVALCPTHALEIRVNGELANPVVDGEAFPRLIRRRRVNQEAFEGDGPVAVTDTTYIDECPVGAISADVVVDEEGAVVAVQDVEIDRALCINCTHCMETGPKGAFEIIKPYKGRVFLDISLCPEGCQACADACPTAALVYDGEKVEFDRRFCLFCGACEQVCPVEGENGVPIIHVERSGFAHTPVESGAWARAVEKLVSYQETAREYAVKGQQRRRKLVLEALLGIEVDAK